MGGISTRCGKALILLVLGGTASRAAAEAPRILQAFTTPASPAAEDAPIFFSIDAADGDPGAALEYRWRFGDDSAFTAWNASSTTSHTYADPGQYEILAQVRDETGLVAAVDLSLVLARNGAPFTVAEQERFLKGRSGPIAVDALRRRVWVVNPDADTVSVLDADALTLLLEIPVGKHPSGLALDGDGRAWVACRDADEVRVVAPGGSTVRTLSLPRGSRPVTVVFGPDGSAAHVAERATGRIRRFDADTFAETGLVSVGPAPEAMTVTPDGSTLLAARFISDVSGGRVTSVGLPGLTVLGTTLLPTDTATQDAENAGRGVPNYIAGLAVTPDGARVLYAAKKDNILRGLFRDGAALTFETSVRTLVGRLEVAARTEDVPARRDLDNTCRASSVLVSPSEAHVFVTLEGNNLVSVRDARDGRELARGTTGAAPQGMALDPATGRLFVQNFMDRSVSVFNAAALLGSGGHALPRLAVVGTVGAELLPPDVLQGKRLFYTAVDRRVGHFDGYMSCAVCHLDGDQDGQVWDFTDRGEGLRNTISLRGRAGTGHGRVHWSANFDEIQDFEHDIRAGFGGNGFLSDFQFHEGTRDTPLGDAKAGLSPDLDALAAYVASLADTAPSPHKDPGGAMTAAGQAGEIVFQRLNCAACHGGGVMTDSPKGLLHDVGTIRTSSGKRLDGMLEGLDTPTLKGLWDSAPYLHDGSAATLADVLNHAEAGRHGGMNVLTAPEKSDLVQYLLQLDDDEGEPDMAAVVAISSVTALAGPEGSYRLRISSGAPVVSVEVLANGASLGGAAQDADGNWVKTVAVGTARTALQARALRADGGTSLSAEAWVGSAAPNGVPPLPRDERPLLLTAGRADGVNDAIDFGPGAEDGEIFNLRGASVHRGTSWDGSVGGRTAPSGLYVARVKGRDGSTLYKKILIVR